MYACVRVHACANACLRPLVIDRAHACERVCVILYVCVRVEKVGKLSYQSYARRLRSSQPMSSNRESSCDMLQIISSVPYITTYSMVTNCARQNNVCRKT